MADHTEHQKKIIKRFYDNRDDIDQDRLSEMVTNLYLTDSAKQKTRIWQKAEETMLRLGVPESRVTHVVGTQDPAILAEVVSDLQAGKI